MARIRAGENNMVTAMRDPEMFMTQMSTEEVFYYIPRRTRDSSVSTVAYPCRVVATSTDVGNENGFFEILWNVCRRARANMLCAHRDTPNTFREGENL